MSLHMNIEFSRPVLIKIEKAKMQLIDELVQTN